jgi:hypothetical protein
MIAAQALENRTAELKQTKEQWRNWRRGWKRWNYDRNSLSS